MWRQTSALALVALLVQALPVLGQETKPGLKTMAPATTMQVQKLKPKPRGEIVGVRPTTAMPLTTQECTTLGGESVAEGVCNSGKACQTRDQNGDWHRVCISAAQ